MRRPAKIGLIVFVAGIIGAAFYLRSLQQKVLELGKTQKAEQDSRRELEQPKIATATDVRVKASIFRASKERPGELEAVTIELPLSSEPVQRAKQLLFVLLSPPEDEKQRTLPAETRLLEFYLLPDGTGVADFSEALGTQTPSGIGTEQLAVESIVRTLEENVAGIKRLKILVRGAEMDSLAGHVDLTGFFNLKSAATTAEKKQPN